MYSPRHIVYRTVYAIVDSREKIKVIEAYIITVSFFSLQQLYVCLDFYQRFNLLHALTKTHTTSAVDIFE